MSAVVRRQRQARQAVQGKELGWRRGGGGGGGHANIPSQPKRKENAMNSYEQEQKNKIIFALRKGPLHRSALAESIPGFYSSYFDIYLDKLIKEKRIIAYKERPNGVVRTAYQLAEWTPELVPPDSCQPEESMEKMVPCDENHSEPEFDSAESCDLDLIVLDADSGEGQASNASNSDSALFGDLSENPPDDQTDEALGKNSKPPEVSRSGWVPTILIAIFALVLLLVIVYDLIPTSSPTGKESSLVDFPMMDATVPVLRYSDEPKPVYVGTSSFKINLKARTSTPAAILRSLAEGIPEGNNTVRLYQVELSVLPAKR